MTSASEEISVRTIVVIPCFNEEKRLDTEAFIAAAAQGDRLRFVFVDDGSTDATLMRLDQLCEAHPEVGEVLRLERNGGKAEAVRIGMLHAATSHPEFVGYWDADLATPLVEIARFVEVFDERPEIEIVMGSRVNLLGRQVRRRLPRHYLSRVFATMVAAGLSLPVYDTQCGAKLFRCTPDVMQLFAEPFFAKWIFDAELLARAIDRHEVGGLEHVKRSTFELPLLQWSEVRGSSLGIRGLLGAARDWTRIYGRHTVMSRWRRGNRGLTYRVVSAIRGVLNSMVVDGTRISRLGRFWRAIAVIPVFGTFVLWTRLRSWLSGPVSYEVKSRDGTRFVCRLPDLVQSYLFVFGAWEPDLTAFIERRMEPGRSFIDVGANIGYHSFVASKRATSSGRVIAIEALPEICDQLRLHLELNPEVNNITVINKAASNHAGELTMYRGPLHNTGLATSVAERGFDMEATVECAPLDALIEDVDIENARLVKIDVEGSEGDVLAGMDRFLDRCQDDVEILVELSPKWWADSMQTPEKMLAPLLERGFHAYEIDNNLWPWRYLWLNVVKAPTRSRRNFKKKTRRIDLVLSRVDAPFL